MSAIIRVVKDLLLPASLNLLLIGLAIGVVLICAGQRARRLGRAWLVGLVLLYWIWATPFVGDTMMSGLSYGYGSLADAAAAKQARAIVVLSGGSRSYLLSGLRIHETTPSTALRTLEAARVYRMIQPDVVFVSGGMGDARVQLEPESDVMRQRLVDLGVPADRIVLEPASRTTREQAMNLAPLIRERRADPFVLVTSPYHIRRATRLFTAAGLHPIASMAPLRTEGIAGRSSFLPSSDGLQVSEIGMREWMALAYYFARGWI